MSALPDLNVLFEDFHLLIVNKPAPLLTQAPAGIPSLEGMVKEYIKVKYAKPAGVYLGVPHRLDRPVTGAICFARNTKAAQRVHAQFHERTVRKTYWAIVEGIVTPASGIWDDCLRKLPDEAKVVKASAGEPGAKLAVLEYRVLQTLVDCTFVEFAPITGRMHQLRVQSAWRGHPVLGDMAYAAPRAFGPPAAEPRDCVIALHARRLELDHPFTKLRMAIDAPLPEYWSDLGIAT